MCITKIRVRYPDVDRMGVVHHAVYPIWYELAREDFFEKLYMTPTRMEKEKKIVLPIIHLHAHYFAPVYPEDILEMQVHIRNLTETRIELGYELLKEDHVLCHKGETVHAWASTDTFKTINLATVYPEVYQIFCENKSYLNIVC